MNREEAKFILSSLRPEEAAEPDPHLREALRRAEGDEELQNWLEDRCEFDRALGAKLGEVQPPADLRSSILTGVKVSRPASRRRLGTLLAVAAGIAVAFLSLSHWKPTSPQPIADRGDPAGSDAFRREMVTMIRQVNSVDRMTSSEAEVRQWFRSHSGDPDFTMPAELKRSSLTGCHLLDWRGGTASLICFRARDGGGAIPVHLVVVPSERVPDVAPDPPELVREGGWITALWRDDDRVYLMASPAEEERFRGWMRMG